MLTGKRTLIAALIFLGLSLALWAQQTWLPDAPLPSWIPLVLATLAGPVMAGLRALTTTPMGKAKPTVPKGVCPRCGVLLRFHDGGPCTPPEG